MANTPSREQIMSALFKLISQSASYVTASRRFQLWDDVPMEARPAIFMLERNEDSQYSARGTGGGVVTYSVDVFIYTNANDAEVPAAVLNPLLDALDAVLAPPYPGALQTLNGLVTHVYTDGQTLKDPGDLDGDGIAIVPVKVRAMAP